ncbi:MAG: metallophosphoesterase [Thermodesulfobacteriota bacterium]
MKAPRKSLAFALFLFLAAGFMGCAGDSGDGQPFAAWLGGMAKMHDLYYVLDPAADTIEIVFNLPLREGSVAGNLSFSDKTGALDQNVSVEVRGNRIFLRVKNGFGFLAGWKYLVTLGAGVESALGSTLGRERVLEIRTAARNILAQAPAGLPGGGNGLPAQNAIVALSDVHMGEDRAVNNGYCWFSDNSDALLALVTDLETNQEVRELVILGDLFDEWLIPYDAPPYDPPVADDRDYFFSVRNAKKNSAIVDVLGAIAAAGTIAVTYVHGNHDMKLAQDVFQDLVPGAAFQGTPDGLGIYSPVDGVVMEHGHRYDFFNSPQPLANPGHILPPGYFVTRMWAKGMEAEAAAGANTVGVPSPYGEVEFTFPAAWDVTMLYTEDHFPDLVHPSLSDPIILMSGIDGYPGPFSFDGARDMYVNGNIESNWPATQTQNQVNVHIGVFEAIVNGQSNLDEAAREEYLENAGLSPKVNVVVFGHTHNPMLETFPRLSRNVKGIYANTGSWVNQNVHGYIGGTPNNVRTFVVILPAQWTGSDLTVVTLYQYNQDPVLGWQAVKLAEDSVDADT